MPVREKFDIFKKDNPLFRDVKEYNKYLLLLISVSILVLTGVISYFVSGSYARWNTVVESSNTLKLGVKSPNLDESGSNKPELTSNMIPVYYDNTSSSWKKADENNRDEAYKWYDYDSKMWANAVTVTEVNRDTYLKASAGTERPMDDINTM